MINVEIRRKERSRKLLERVLSGENIANAVGKVIGNKGAGEIDKVIQQSIVQVLSPIYEEKFFLLDYF